MSLPVVLLPGQVSIMPKPSPNSITPNPDAINKLLSRVGLVDAVDNTGTSQVSAGQYVWYRVRDEQIIVAYGNKNYTIINQDDIKFVENPFIPPP